MKIKNLWEEFKDYRTERQWRQLGFALKATAVGIELWTNAYCQHTRLYYSPDEVYKLTGSMEGGDLQ